MKTQTNNSKNSLSHLTDMELLTEAQKGSGLAFELIIRRHNQALFRAAKGVLRDDDQAQESVQEAYLKAFMNMDTFQHRASLKTWLTRITINQAISIKRRNHPLISLDQKNLHLQGNQSEESEMSSCLTYKHTPESVVDQQEMKRLLERAVKRLPQMYRSVFMLRAVEGMSVKECAFCLKTSESVIKKRLSRAREMLRKDLTKYMSDQESVAFEFAGKRCDVVTSFVMNELVQLNKIYLDRL